MEKYPKINSVFKRTESGKMLFGEYAQPEFCYLKDCIWDWTEKVDGTNIRVWWERGRGHIRIGGRTDNAQIQLTLLERLQELFDPAKFDAAITKADTLTLYGEGYGAKIQRGGGKYKADGVDFVLFDVRCGDIWLDRLDVKDVAKCLNIDAVPVVGRGDLAAARALVAGGMSSTWGNFQAEGLVMRPTTELQTKTGNRIITKIKYRDYHT